MNIEQYIKAINEQFRTGIAREHSYRPMLQQLLDEQLPSFVVTNEPARIDCGAPDFIISSKKTNTPVFYIEAKDIDDRDLDGRKENRSNSLVTRKVSTMSFLLTISTFIYMKMANG